MNNVVPIERDKATPNETLGDVQSAGWRWLNWAWEQRLGNTTLKSVLVALAGHADAKGECWPSVPRLCDRSDAKVRAVQNALRELERRGLVVTIPRTGTSNLYRLTPAHDAPPQEVHPARDAASPRITRTPHPQQVHRTPAGDAPKLPRTPKEQPNEDIAPIEAQTVEVSSEFFDEFAAAFPRIGNLEKTETALRQAISDGAKPEVILAGAKAYAVEQKGNRPRYILYSENWVAQARWVQFEQPAADLDQTVDLYADMIREGKRIFGGPLKPEVRSELQSRHGIRSEEIDAALVSA